MTATEQIATDLTSVVNHVLRYEDRRRAQTLTRGWQSCEC